MPPNMTYQPLKPLSSTPVKEFPFILDPFQREALRCVENSQSVLVSAHTSAGKTVVAEYAIATSLRDTQRVIYTTPIKVHTHTYILMKLPVSHELQSQLPVSHRQLPVSQVFQSQLQS